MNVINAQSLVECPICCDFLTAILETPCCHALFCKSCLEDWHKGTNNCPSCRSKFVLRNCTQNIPIQRFVDALPVDCPYKLNGCQINPPRSELDRHKKLCIFSDEKIAVQKRQKLDELKAKKERVELLEKEIRDNGLANQDPQLATKTLKLASELYELGKSLFEMGAFKEANWVVARALDLRKTIAGEFSASVAECIHLLAKSNKADAKYEVALSLYQQSMDINKANIDNSIECLIHIGDIHLKQANYNEASKQYFEALALAKEKLGPTSEKTADILNALGLLAKKCSEYDKATQYLNDAMNITNSDSANWSEIILNLADVYRKTGKYKEARDLYLKSLNKLQSQFGDNHPQIATVCNALGMLEKKEGQYEEALKHYGIALKIGKHFFGDAHPDVGMYLTNLGDIHRKKGEFKKAEAVYFKAIGTLENALGKNHVEVAEVLNSMGLVLKKRADYDGAEKLYRRAIDIVTKTFGEKHYKVGIYLNNLADIERKRGNYQKALTIYNRGLKAIESTLGVTHSEYAEILHNIGLVQHQLGNYQEATKFYTSALKIVKKEFGDKHYKVGMFLNNSGMSRAMLNDFETAYDEMKTAVNILIVCLGRNHVEVADCYSNLGDVCMKLQIETPSENKLQEAVKYYKEAKKIIQETFGEEHTKCKQFDSLLFICENLQLLQG